MAPLVHVFLVLTQFVTFVIAGEPQVLCYFIFGDSLVDSGNNNDLDTKSKANYVPYGVDFPLGITGRFCNGRTMADIIGQLLGFEDFIPPYTTTDEQISKGVNYGSGSAGIREETGTHLGDNISMNGQFSNHNNTISRLSRLQQNETYTREYLRKCIYLVNIGSNDYINNYYLPQYYTTSRIYTTDRYAPALLQEYSQQLRTLYNMGGRKVVVVGLAEIGCIPAMIVRFGTDGKLCNDALNNVVQLFNNKLKELVDELNVSYSDARFTFINVSRISSPKGDISFTYLPCCPIRDDGQCIPNSVPCPVRSMIITFDGLHPTDISNTVIATRSYHALSPLDASPYDISHLAQL